MHLEYEQITKRQSWPTTTDMTMSDTYPRHVDFEMTTSERQAQLTGLICYQILEIERGGA